MQADYASLCVLSFNRPHLLRTSLQTLAEHADYPFELLIHDDGSSDPDVLDFLHGLQRDGAVSTLILNAPGQNQGQGVALNRLFAIATGDPIIKLDHDLIYEPGWLRDTVQLLERNAGRVYSAPAVASSDEPAIGLLGLLHYYHEPVDSRRTKVADWDGWTEHTHILGSAFAMPREAWDRFGPFDQHSPAFAEDAEMQRVVTESGEFVCALPPRDLCMNVGMGIGPSTVNVAPGEVQTINYAPRVFAAERAAA